MAAISFPSCLVLVVILSFVMEGKSDLMIAEIIIGAVVLVVYHCFMESERQEIKMPMNSKIAGCIVERGSSSTSTSASPSIATTTRGGGESNNKEGDSQNEAEESTLNYIAKLQGELDAQETRRMFAAEEQQRVMEAEEFRRLKQLDKARLQAEAEQAARLLAEEDVKRRAFEQKELSGAAILQAEAEEFARLQSEIEEATRMEAESTTKRKVEEKAARAQELENEERKLQELREAPLAFAESKQAYNHFETGDESSKVQVEDNKGLARQATEDLKWPLAEKKPKDEAGQRSVSSHDEEDAKFEEGSKRESMYGDTFRGSIGYLADTAAGSNATLTMRVRILNETTKRSKDVVVPVCSSLSIEEAIYDNRKVREAGVRKWPKQISRAVKREEYEVVCLLLDPKTTNVILTFLVADMRDVSTETVHEMASPEPEETVRMMLKYRNKTSDGQSSDSGNVVSGMEALSKLDGNSDHSEKSSIYSIHDVTTFSSEDEAERTTPTAAEPTSSELSEIDTAGKTTPKEEMEGANSGTESADGDGVQSVDGAQSVSDGSTFSSRSIESKRRRKRELEARRVSLSASQKSIDGLGQSFEGGGTGGVAGTLRGLFPFGNRQE